MRAKIATSAFFTKKPTSEKLSSYRVVFLGTNLVLLQFLILRNRDGKIKQLKKCKQTNKKKIRNVN